MTKDKRYYEEWAERLCSEVTGESKQDDIVTPFGSFSPSPPFNSLQMEMLDRMIREIIKDSIDEMSNEIIIGLTAATGMGGEKRKRKRYIVPQNISGTDRR